jgi:dTDP-4-dehydrorhamnose reductase
MYRESDVPAPLNYYGLSKLLGEVAVTAILSNSVIVRVSGLYGYSPTGKKNFGIVAFEKLSRGEPVEAFVDQWLSPTYVKFLAEKLIKLVEARITGVIHIAGERLSRYEFASILAEILGASKDLVKPKRLADAKFVAPRPRDSSLDTSKARELGLALPSARECLKDMVETYRKLSRSGK